MKVLAPILLIVIALGAFLFFKDFFGGEKVEQKPKVVEVPVVKVQEVPTVDVLVARTAVPVGAKLKPENVDKQAWPSHLVLPGFIVSDGKQDADVSGLVARAPFQAREPIIRTKLANPNDPSFLAAGLDEGNRAVTIAVDGLSAVAGFIFPGDRVDVLISQQVNLGPVDPDNPQGPKLQEQIMEVLMPNVKVIAIDQFASMDASQGIKVPSSITLEVSRAQAQKVKLGEQRGKLTLALRPFESEEEGELPRPTTQVDLTRVTPPSFFPVLYNTDVQYPAALVNVFAENAKKAVEVVGAGANQSMAKEIEAKLQGGLAASGGGMSGVAGMMQSSSVAAPSPTVVNASKQQEPVDAERGKGADATKLVKIIRGTAIEEKEVSRQ